MDTPDNTLHTLNVPTFVFGQVLYTSNSDSTSLGHPGTVTGANYATTPITNGLTQGSMETCCSSAPGGDVTIVVPVWGGGGITADNGAVREAN